MVVDIQLYFSFLFVCFGFFPSLIVEVINVLTAGVLQAKEVKSRFGDVDVLVNNAGVVCGKPILEFEASEIRHTIDVNLMSQFWASYTTHSSCLCN